jgi:hypothetical protein
MCSKRETQTSLLARRKLGLAIVGWLAAVKYALGAHLIA